MENIKVSLFASAVRPQFYKTFLDSLRGTSVPYEVVFAGNKPPLENKLLKKFDFMGRKDNVLEYENNFFYILTENLKPAQCYEIARRACKGELVHWTADDCEYSPDCMSKAYNFWKALNDRKAILSIQTKENGMMVNMDDHSFFGWNRNSPLMAPLGLMSREYLNDLGGLDRRYICGQYENDIVMRTLADGGSVHVWREGLITIDHYRRHGLVRPFATGYNKDREILEGSWAKDGKVINQQRDNFEPYEDEGILEKSQSFNNSKLWA